MEYGMNGLAERVRRELEASYHKHGCGPAFWDTYQQVLDRLVPQGTERTEVTNEMALIIDDAEVDATFALGVGCQNPNMGDISIERDRLKGLQDLAQAAGGERHHPRRSELHA